MAGYTIVSAMLSLVFVSRKNLFLCAKEKKVTNQSTRNENILGLAQLKERLPIDWKLGYHIVLVRLVGCGLQRRCPLGKLDPESCPLIAVLIRKTNPTLNAYQSRFYLHIHANKTFFLVRNILEHKEIVCD